MRRPLAAAGLVVVAFALAGVALGERPHAAAATLPACARAGAPVSSLASFPLPRGTVLDRRTHEYGYVVLRGRVPGYINPVRDWLVSHVPASGFRITGGDAEAAEAEASFTGHGVRGRWKVRELPGCPGALTLQLAYRR